MIRKIFGWILIYALFVYCLLTFWPGYDFYPLRLDPVDSINNLPLFLILGWVFWLIYDIIRYILKFITIPFNALSFGFVHLLLNVAILYTVPYFVSLANTWTIVTMWSILEVAIMAFMLSIIGLLIKHL